METEQQSLEAVIYTRVSSDKSGHAKSVAEQEAECRAECARRGWPVVRTVCDNDRSATRYAARSRDGYAQLAGLLTPGTVLVTWEASRAQRDLAAYVTLRDLCAERGVAWSYSGRLFDLTDGGDRFATGLDALVAEREAEDIRKRILRSQRAARSAGRPAGRLLFGYRVVRDPDTGKAVGREPDPIEGLIVRECAERALRGESVGSIAADLNRRRVARRSGAGWTTQTVGKLLVNPSYAGLRVHLGRVLDVPGTWPALITPDQHADLLALYAARKGGPRGHAPRYLVSGLATCAECGGRLWRHKGGRNADGSHTNVYVCENSCAARKIDVLDEAVHEIVEGLLTSPEAMAALAEVPAVDPAVPVRLAELREQLAAVETEMAEGRMPAATGARVATRLEQQIADAEAAAAPVYTDPVVRDLAAAPDPVAVWRNLPLTAQRDFIRAVLVIKIERIGKGRWADKRKGIRITPRRLHTSG